MEGAFHRPVVVLGAARSGTTFLAETLAYASDVAYWIEPKYVWSYGAADRSHDVRTEAEATPEIRDRIRRSFRRFLKRSGKTRLLEKTPTNCFRVPFVRAVLPEAFLVHLVRDGRDVALSAENKWTTRPDRTALLRRLRNFEIPATEALHYIPDIARDVIGRMVIPQAGFVWGPRFPGIQEFRQIHSVLETCAMQWRRSVEAVRAALDDLPPHDWMEVRYETMVRDPAHTFRALMERAGLGESEEVIARAEATVAPESVGRWRRSQDRMGTAVTLIHETLVELQYE